MIRGAALIKNPKTIKQTKIRYKLFYILKTNSINKENLIKYHFGVFLNYNTYNTYSVSKSSENRVQQDANF